MASNLAENATPNQMKAAFDPKTHPVQDLIFYVDKKRVSGNAMNVMESGTEKLAPLREWVLGPPVFVNELDHDRKPFMGGLLQIYPSYSSNPLPPKINRQHFEEVKALIDVMQGISADHRIPIAFELNGEQIGRIRSGSPDQGLLDGLLYEWEKAINAAENAAGQWVGEPALSPQRCSGGNEGG